MMNPSVSSAINPKEKALAAILLLLVLATYYNGVVIRGRTFMSTIERSYQLGHYHYSGTYWHVSRKFPTIDPAAANQINLPTAALENHYLKTLQLPLWNPFSGLGRPYNADMNSYAFFLPIYLFKLFPSLIMYDLFLLLRLFVAGFFLYLLLRFFRCPVWGALAGAAFYMFNSHFQAYVDMDHLNVTMWLSPMAYLLVRFLFSLNTRFLFGFILCSAGSFYGGNPNEFILVHFFLICFFAFLLAAKKNGRLEKKPILLFYLVLGLGLSLLTASLKLIPFLEFWRNSYSSRTGGATGTAVFLPVRRFLTQVLTPNTIFEGPNYWGYLILGLTLFSLFNLARKRWRFREKLVAFHGVMLFFVISKVCNAPYIKWIGNLPLFSDIHYVKYCSLIYYLTSVLAAFALIYLGDPFRDVKAKVIRVLIFSFCVFSPHILFGFLSKDLFFRQSERGQTLLYISAFFLIVGSFVIFLQITHQNRFIKAGALVTLAVMAVLELRLNSHQHYPKRFQLNDKAPYTQFLLKQSLPFRAIGMDGTLSPNCNLVYPIPTINRMFAMRVTRPTLLLGRLVTAKFDSGMGQVYSREEILDNPYLDLMNTKYYVSESVIDALIFDPEYAEVHKVKSLLNNPSMQYTRCGNLYYYTHWGWLQTADSSVDIPVRLPDGEVFLKSTALAFNFDWGKRENPENRLNLTISAKHNGTKKIVYSRSFVAHRHRDFLGIKVNLSKYAGQDVLVNLALNNPGAENTNDRSLFFGNLRIVYNRIKKKVDEESSSDLSWVTNELEPVPYEEVFSHHATVYRNNRALERGFVLYDARKVGNIYEAISLLKKEPLIYKKTALVEGDLPDGVKLGKTGRSRVVFVDYRANSLKIDVESTEDGLFILSDAYYPGWKAYLDGKRVSIYPAFGALRAVVLPKGKHELKFCYRPTSFYWGALLTLLSLIFCGFCFKKNILVFKLRKSSLI